MHRRASRLIYGELAQLVEHLPCKQGVTSPNLVFSTIQTKGENEMSKFKCPKCNQEFKMNYWKWIFTTIFHWFSFKELRDYRKTKCPLCGEKSWMKREK